MNYIVTGAGGHLGSTILRILKSKKCEIRALLFYNEKPKVESGNIRYYYGDVSSMSSLEPLFTGIKGEETYVIHTAAVISIQNKVTEAMYRTNVLGVRNIVRECIAHKVKRLVHVSSVHAIPELPEGKVQREIYDFQPDLVKGGYAKTKAMGARIVMESAGRKKSAGEKERAKGLDAVVVLPSGIIGPYDTGGNHLIQMAKEFLMGELPACVGGGYDLVDVRDVAEGCIAACEKGERGEAYILSGEYMSIENILREMQKMTDVKPVPKVPAFAARAGLPFITAYSRVTGQRPLYTEYSLDVLKSNAHFSHEKASKYLGYKPRDIRKSIRDMTEFLKPFCEPSEKRAARRRTGGRPGTAED